MLDAILNLTDVDSGINSAEKSPSKNSQYQKSVGSVHVTDETEAIFISSLYNGIGLTLEGSSRLVFDDFVKKITGFIKVDDTPSKRATLSESRTVFIYD